jgi:hypothetical protein
VSRQEHLQRKPSSPAITIQFLNRMPFLHAVLAHSSDVTATAIRLIDGDA